jgi:hypothetical protein
MLINSFRQHTPYEGCHNELLYYRHPTQGRSANCTPPTTHQGRMQPMPISAAPERRPIAVPSIRVSVCLTAPGQLSRLACARWCLRVVSASAIFRQLGPVASLASVSRLPMGGTVRKGAHDSSLCRPSAVKPATSTGRRPAMPRGGSWECAMRASTFRLVNRSMGSQPACTS